MPPDSLLVVGGQLPTVRKAKDLGLRVVSLQHPTLLAPGVGELVDSLIVTDFTRWDTVRPMVMDAHRRYRFTRAVSLTEVGQETASRFNELLGLGGTPPEATRMLLDKWAMRRRLAELPARALDGLVPVAAEQLEDGTSLADFGKRYGYPLVVKPTNGTAGLGAFRVDRPEQVADAIARVEQLRQGQHPYAWLFPLERFLVEEYVDGPEYSVETFSFRGHHVVVAVVEKASRHDFVEIGHAVPARLSRSQEDALVAGAVAFLDAVGVVDGAGHTEIKLSPAGPRLIESHNRTGGDRIVDLLELSYGIDLEHYTVAWPVGLVEPLPARPAPRQAAATRFLTAVPGKVTRVRGAEEVRAGAGVVDVDLAVGPGSVVRPLTDNWARVGQVLALGPSTAHAVRRCEKHATAVTIDTI